MAFMSLKADGAHRPPVIETLVENSSIKVDRVTARGQITPPGHFADEQSNELIFMLQGELVLEYEGDGDKVSLKPGEYAIKSPKQRTRADVVSEENTVWLKVSWIGESGRYPLFTGAVSSSEMRKK